MRWAVRVLLVVVTALVAPVHADAGVFRVGDATAYDVAVLPDGRIVMAGLSGGVTLRAPDGTLTTLTDFQAEGIAVAPDGSLLGISGSDNVVRRWTPGQGVRVVASAGLRLESIEPQTYGVAATADGGFVFTDSVFPARQLTIPIVRRLAGGDQGDRFDSDHLSLGRRCRRFGSRRVDCEVRRNEDDIHECSDIASITLARSGIVLRREYACGSREHARFRQHPRFFRAYGVRTLSRHDNGAWELG